MNLWHLWIMLALSQCGAYGQASVHEVGPSLLPVLLDKSSSREKVVFSEAVSILQKMETAPGCTRLAAVDLVNDCNSFTGKSEEVLDAIKTEYAAKLAICEIQEVSGFVARECSILIPSGKACIKGGFRSYWTHEEPPTDKLCYPDFTRAQLGKCLQALEARQQSWTSYSINRQNAYTICQASREAMERDQTLKIYQNLTEVVQHVTSSFADRVADLLHNIETAEEKLRAAREQSMEDTQQQSEAVLNVLNDLKARVSDDTDLISQRMSNSLDIPQAKAQSVVEIVEYLHDRFLEVQDQLAAQGQQMQLRQENLLAVTQMSEDELQSVIKAAKFMADEVANLHNVINQTKDDMGGVRQGLTDANQSVAGLNQTLSGLDEKTGNLRQALDIGANFINGVYALYNFFTSPKPWVAMSTTIFTFGLWHASRISAGNALTFLGAISLAWLATIHFNSSTVQSLKTVATEQSPTFLITIVLLPMALAFGIWSIKFAYLYQFSDATGTGVIPRIEMPVDAAVQCQGDHNTWPDPTIVRSIETPDLPAKPYYYRTRTGKGVLVKADVPENSIHRTGSPDYFDHDRFVRSFTVC